MPDNKLGSQRANTKGVLPQTKGIRKPGAARRTQSNATSSTALKQTRIPKAATGEKRQKVKIRKVSHKKKLKNRSNLPYLLLFVVFCVCVVFFSSFLSYTYLVDKYNNPTSIESIYIDPETEVKFKIERGATTKDIANNLKEMGLIRNTEVYRFLSKFNGYDGRYKAGTYTLSKGLNYDEI
ncbi:MAG TPA: endolytic transglycosylase MltG, partial [Clostridia bacterium]|nr:endolytic transglycosylase MltG [Clostridia bacterium]